MWSRSVLLLSLLGPFSSACSETVIRDGQRGDRIPDDSTDNEGYDGVEIDGEYCNGIDDDGDGLIDEGFPDTDGDGLLDCFEQDCNVRMYGDRAVRIDPECHTPPFEPPEDPWDVVVEWRYEIGDKQAGSYGVVTMPAVGNLTDDNLDGFIDDRDVPDIVFTTMGTNRLVALNGDDGSMIFTLPGYMGQTSVAIADVNGDGKSEIIAMKGGFTPSVHAIDGTGNVVWASPGRLDAWPYQVPVVADLEGDGDVEIIFDNQIINGTDGSIQGTLELPKVNDERYGLARMPVVADIDMDGVQEIMISTQVYDPSGRLEWAYDDGFAPRCNTAIANMDDDPEAEVFMVSGEYLQVFEADGTPKLRGTLPAANAGPPCVADFDGDGEVEIGMGVGTWVGVYELDGTKVWEHRSVDVTTAHAGCSGYDFDGDGAYELLHADMHAFYIFDGRTGEVRYRNDKHSSTTIFEYPVVADVDRDGSAEIVLVSNTPRDLVGWAGVTVLGHRDNGWARSGHTWAVHDFAVTNINPDGSVPTRPRPSWAVHNVFRARPHIDSPNLANLTIKVDDVCVGTCEGGPVKISYTVANDGGLPVRAGTRVSLYIVDGFEWTHTDTQVLGPIPPGVALASQVFELQPWDMGTAFVLAVDDDGSDQGAGIGLVEECNEDDNIAIYEDDICGGTP